MVRKIGSLENSSTSNLEISQPRSQGLSSYRPLGRSHSRTLNYIVMHMRKKETGEKNTFGIKMRAHSNNSWNSHVAY